MRTTDDAAEVMTEYRFNLDMVTTPEDFPGDMYLLYAVNGIRLADQTADFVPVSGTMFIRFLPDALVVKIQFADGMDIDGEEEATTIELLDFVQGTFITEREDGTLSGVAAQFECGPLPES